MNDILVKPACCTHKQLGHSEELFPVDFPCELWGLQAKYGLEQIGARVAGFGQALRRLVQAVGGFSAGSGVRSFGPGQEA